MAAVSVPRKSSQVIKGSFEVTIVMLSLFDELGSFVLQQNPLKSIIFVPFFFSCVFSIKNHTCVQEVQENLRGKKKVNQLI